MLLDSLGSKALTRRSHERTKTVLSLGLFSAHLSAARAQQMRDEPLRAGLAVASARAVAMAREFGSRQWRSCAPRPVVAAAERAVAAAPGRSLSQTGTHFLQRLQMLLLASYGAPPPRAPLAVQAAPSGSSSIIPPARGGPPLLAGDAQRRGRHAARPFDAA